MAIENIVYQIPKKEFYDYFIKDGFVDHIANDLLNKLGDCVMKNLVAEGEIVVKLLELSKEEFTPTNSIQLKRQIIWKPLTRCKECIHYNDGLCYRVKWAFAVEPTDFCSSGNRRAEQSQINTNDKQSEEAVKEIVKDYITATYGSIDNL